MQSTKRIQCVLKPTLRDKGTQTLLSTRDVGTDTCNLQKHDPYMDVETDGNEGENEDMNEDPDWTADAAGDEQSDSEPEIEM
jgi:hypothetical protein